MPDVLTLSIVVLRVEPDIWCDPCGVPSAMTVVYVLDRGDGAPAAVASVTWCEGCADR